MSDQIDNDNLALFIILLCLFLMTRTNTWKHWWRGTNPGGGAGGGLRVEKHPLAGKTVNYAIRRGFAGLPVDDNVLYGKVDGLGHLVHVSEIVEEDLTVEKPEYVWHDGTQCDRHYRCSLCEFSKRAENEAPCLDCMAPNSHCYFQPKKGG